MVEQVFIYGLPSERLGCMTWSQGQPVAYSSAQNVNSLLAVLKSYRVRLKTERVYDWLPRRAEKDASVLQDPNRIAEIDRAILQMLRTV